MRSPRRVRVCYLLKSGLAGIQTSGGVLGKWKFSSENINAEYLRENKVRLRGVFGRYICLMSIRSVDSKGREGCGGEHHENTARHPFTHGLFQPRGSLRVLGYG